MEDNNMLRNETVLILPHNTLRLTDAMLQMEIDNAKGNLLKEDFDEMLWRLVSRKYKDLSKYNKDVDKELINELYEKNFANYYDLSPKTLMCETIDILSNQKFVKKSTILFPHSKAKDDAFDYDYYDGSIESLEQYMNSHGITCLIFDDMELLKTLNERKNVSLERKTFMVSKLGYNFFRDESGNLRLKYYDDIHKEVPTLELAIMDLFHFPQSVLDKFNKKKNN